MSGKGGGKKKGKGGGRKKSANTKTPVIIDGLSTEDMSKEQLEEHVKRIREELDREREERNYFQLERDKVNTFWEITKRQLEEKKAELRNKDREMEESEERHQVEIKVYKQKVKHLLFEHQNGMTQFRAENSAALQIEREENRVNEFELRQDKRDLKIELKEQELAHEEMMKNLRKTHEEEMTVLRVEFMQRSTEIEQKYEKKLKTLREELDLKWRTALHEVEERKNTQINALMRNHEKAFGDIKNYYNDITLNNLSLINTLKEQITESKKAHDSLLKQMADVTSENKKLQEMQLKSEVTTGDLQRKLANYDKDKILLATAKGRLKATEGQLKELEWEHEVLAQQFQKVEQERNEIYDKFVKAVHEVQQKSNFKNLLLEKKLGLLADSLEKKETQLNEVLSVSNLDSSALGSVTKKLEDILDAKNSTIQDLQYELARISKAHNDLLRTYEAKLIQFGIPVEELGFKPLDTANLCGQTIGQGPAGLISAS